MSKPGITQLLIASAVEPELRARLLASPDQVFLDFDLTEEQKELLRRPDHRLLPLLGAALATQEESTEAKPAPGAPAEPPHAVISSRALPDISLALTVVPCLRQAEGEPPVISYAIWVNPLPAGVAPETLPAPPGTNLPGRPLSPLYAVMQISALQLQDAGGNPQVGLTASLLRASNFSGLPAPESAGDPRHATSGTNLATDSVQAAVQSVRTAVAGERYQRLLDLLRVLRQETPQ